MNSCFPQIRSAHQTTRAIIPVALLSLGLTLIGCASDNSMDNQSSSTKHTQVTSASEAPSESMSDERRQEHVDSFLYVWQSIKDKHWDPDLNGVDWDQAKADLLPIVENAQNDTQARIAMNQLLERLEQSHFGIIPSTAYDRLEEESAVGTDSSTSSFDEDGVDEEGTEYDGPGWAGMNIRLIGDQFFVTKVYDDSPAQRAGIQPGWIVESIRGRDMHSLIEVARETAGVNRPETQAGLIAYSRIQGDAGEMIPMTFSDDLYETQTKSITLANAPGEMAGIGELPPRPIEFEALTLANGVGYFRLNMFMNPGAVLPAYQQFVKDHMDAPGIVIDMRGNFGGIILMAPGMINWLISEKGLTMGTMKMRDDVRGPFDIPLMLNPRKNSYTGKVAVLIDELSISNAEILAAGLKDIGRAKVFGTRSAGLVLPSTVERLPNGDGFQYAFASYTTGGGYSLEGQGAIPDQEIQYTREGLLNGQDEVLDAATQWINSNE